MRPLYFMLFIGIFYAIGLLLVGYGVWSAKRSAAARLWPTTPGKIDSCHLETKTSHDSYEVKVSYHYTVNGNAYTGTRVAFGYNASSGHDAHQQIFAKLQKSKSVDVRYDPTQPDVSTLSFGIHRSIKFILAFGAVWLMFVIGFTWIWWIMS